MSYEKIINYIYVVNLFYNLIIQLKVSKNQLKEIRNFIIPYNCFLSESEKVRAFARNIFTHLLCSNESLRKHWYYTI